MKKDQDFIWTPLSVEHIVQDEWIDFRKVKYRYPDGRVFEPFYQYSRRSYSVIVPVTEDGQYLCVRQFRHGIGEVTTESGRSQPSSRQVGSSRGKRRIQSRQYRHMAGKPRWRML